MATRGFPLTMVRAGCRCAPSRRAVPPAVPPARSEHLLRWGWAAILPAKGSCPSWGGSQGSDPPWIRPQRCRDPGTHRGMPGWGPSGAWLPLVLKVKTSPCGSPEAHRALLSTSRSAAGPGPCPKRSPGSRAQRRRPEERVAVGTSAAASQPCVFDVA